MSFKKQDLLQKTKKICEIYKINPVRSKGQNFLISSDIYDQIIAVSELRSDDIVLEVGPGLGFLTADLARKTKKVITVELDDKLAKFLKDAILTKNINNIEIKNENILDFDFKKEEILKDQEYKIVANLPYNITSIFLRKFLSSNFKPRMMTLMLQKEVAQRICAQPGKMSLLAVSVQFYADAEFIANVLKENFWPTPQVDSAIIKIKVKNNEKNVNEKDFFRLVRIGFSNKRKMLKNNLAAGLMVDPKKVEIILNYAGLDVKCRAEELSLKDWFKLLGEIRGFMV